MKRTLFFIIAIITCSSLSTEAQLLQKIKNRVKETAENKAVNKAGEATEQTIESIENGSKEKEKNNAPDQGMIAEADEVSATNDAELPAHAAATVPKASLISYANYDFVPGDKLIYFYDMAGESDSEIPGRMLINEGNLEVQTYKGEKVLFAPGNSRLHMRPLMKEARYLPEQFTFEFDVLANGGLESANDASQIYINFREKDEQSFASAVAPIQVMLNAISGSTPTYGFQTYNETDHWIGAANQEFAKQAVNPTQDNWRHVSVYINKNIGKLYVDQHRIGMINQVNPGHVGKLEFEVTTNENPILFKNFRIAAGGSDAYNKVVTDGKFIAYGIQFDVNKATLKPESMGTINEFVKMMKQKPDLKFEIGGHTDSDGTDARNNTLSQERADAVKNQMVNLGIDANRLTTKGFGSSKPVTDNSTAENKAKNRRVEFVKK